MVSWCKDYFSSALWRDSKTKQQHSEKNKKKSECCRKIRNHLKRKLWLTSEQINFLVLSSGSCLQPAAHCVKRLLKKGFIIQWWWQSQTENSVIHKAELQLKQRAKLSAEDEEMNGSISAFRRAEHPPALKMIPLMCWRSIYLFLKLRAA